VHPAGDQGAHRLLRRYQAAMTSFSARRLSALYADDGVHEFGFPVPGHAPRYVGSAEVYEAYAAAWARPAIDLVGFRDIAVHETSDPATLIDEWSATARRRSDGGEFMLSGLLVLTARNGLLRVVRDYMDVFGLARHTGRLAALAAVQDGGVVAD
jgi:uncharacterized protein